MASTLVSRPRPRPAHTPGPTRCVYTPDGTKLVTAGSNNTIRVFKTGSDGEPANVDNASDENLALSASNEFFVAGTELGDVSLYSLATNEFETLLFKCTVTVRDVALSPDSKWCAIAGDELTVKLVNPKDITVLQTLQEHGQQTKHLSFDPKGSLLALSCPDGVIYIYSMTSDKPEVIRKIHGMIGKVATDSGTSTKVAWHPDGRAFAVPTPLSNVQVVSKTDWAKQRSFANEHESPITALAWSPNGAMLATAAKDGKLLIWATEDQTVIARLDYPNVVDIAWHPTKNLAAFTTTNGEVYIYDNFVPEQFTRLLDLPLQPAPFYHDPLKEIPNNVRRPELGARKQGSPRPRRDSLGSIDDLLDDGLGGGFDDDFVVDDDGAGYALNGNRKRPAHDDDALGDHPHKRLKLMHPRYHDAFQPSSTPWRGNRKYLCLNMVGFVWTVDQDSHNTITPA
ncbi:hypothetical protein P8C59_006317 [Phyllachora maydis]|uniref:Uncharacterized protein n=1 Tax=Phyllachora maydis TaxID=1825666 RepID=A0AAD9I7X2_9PEZI|nr:hypothetical protein P8C59_006317 [Phyllachora maydis]